MPGSLVIVNPHASRVRDEGPRRRLTEQLTAVLAEHDGQPPRIIETATRSETRPAVESGLADGVGLVVGVGGDGTLRDIAEVLKGGTVPLGIVPAGTGNQVAAVLGIPLSVAEAVAALPDAARRTIDLGEVSLRHGDGSASTSTFMIGCGAGFDARLMATTPSGLKQRIGKSAYVVQAVRLALDLESHPCVLTVDGEEIHTDATIALVGNMGEVLPGLLGLRLPIVPDDGLLDLIAVGARGPVEGLKGLTDQLLRTDLGGAHGEPSVRLRGRRIAVEAAAPAPMQVDGDYVGDGSLEAQVLPDALAVLVPDQEGST